MALKLTLLSVDGPATAVIDAVIQVVLSGNYPAGGDVIDFTTLGGQQSQEGFIIDSDLAHRLPIEAFVNSETGGWGASQGGDYEVSLYTKGTPPVALASTNCKFRAFAAGGAELAAGAYDATITSDYIVMHARFLRER